jgi:hypothetical protein
MIVILMTLEVSFMIILHFLQLLLILRRNKLQCFSMCVNSALDLYLQARG